MELTVKGFARVGAIIPFTHTTKRLFKINNQTTANTERYSKPQLCKAVFALAYEQIEITLKLELGPKQLYRRMTAKP